MVISDRGLKGIFSAVLLGCGLVTVYPKQDLLEHFRALYEIWEVLRLHSRIYVWVPQLDTSAGDWNSDGTTIVCVYQDDSTSTLQEKVTRMRMTGIMDSVTRIDSDVGKAA